MSFRISSPYGSSFNSWVGSLIKDLGYKYNIPSPESENNWKRWACNFIANNNLQSLPSPLTNTFNDENGWIEWSNQIMPIL